MTLDEQQAICTAPISPYCAHHCDFSRIAHAQWPKCIADLRQWQEEERIWKEREAALLVEIERLREDNARLNEATDFCEEEGGCD